MENEMEIMKRDVELELLTSRVDLYCRHQKDDLTQTTRFSSLHAPSFLRNSTDRLWVFPLFMFDF